VVGAEDRTRTRTTCLTLPWAWEGYILAVPRLAADGALVSCACASRQDLAGAPGGRGHHLRCSRRVLTRCRARAAESAQPRTVAPKIYE
jgi:hypothetical protein